MKEAEHGFVELKDVAGGYLIVDTALRWVYDMEYHFEDIFSPSILDHVIRLAQATRLFYDAVLLFSSALLDSRRPPAAWS
jgi:hypothetical protein